MNWPLMILIVLLTIIVSNIFRSREVKKIMQRLFELSKNKDEKGFLDLLESSLCRFMFSNNTRLILKLNFYIRIDDKANSKKTLQEINASKIKAIDRIAANNSMFSFLINRNDYKDAEKVYRDMKPMLNKANDPHVLMLKRDLEQVYDIYINHDVSRIGELEKLAENAANNDAKAIYQFRLAKLFFYDNQKDKCEEMLKSALENTSSQTSKNKIQKILDSGLSGI